MNKQRFIEHSAKKLCKKLWESAQWIKFDYFLLPNGFKISHDGKVTQKYIFDFNKNIFTIFDLKNEKWVQWKSFYIHPNIFEYDIAVGDNYHELNKKLPKDKKFFVDTVVDGYIDPETSAFLTQKNQDPDFGHNDFQSYQKHEICVIYAQNKKTINKWQKLWKKGMKCERDFIPTDSEGNNVWINAIIEESTLKTK